MPSSQDEGILFFVAAFLSKPNLPAAKSAKSQGAWGTESTKISTAGAAVREN